MAQDAPVLHMLCGKAASGKSTLAAVLAEAPATVMISEDAWLSALYGHEMATIPDYLRCAARLEEIIAPHVVALLSAGISVVLDFQANTPERRGWLRAIAEAADAAHALHYLDVPEETCLHRLRARNQGGGHPFTLSQDQFRRLCRHFVAPAPGEGFHIVLHGPSGA